MKSIEEKLWINNTVGGIARYENDDYFRVSKDVQGNPWIICTLWLARWYIATATSKKELTKALSLLEWTQKNASTSGMLGEQLDPNTGHLISVSPLIWSHAEFILTAAEYVEKFKKL
jgi:GH15 family glucan-1,4-alpha-glucosidase